jgi:hypothetical protein
MSENNTQKMDSLFYIFLLPRLYRYSPVTHSLIRSFSQQEATSKQASQPASFSIKHENTH